MPVVNNCTAMLAHYDADCRHRNGITQVGTAGQLRYGASGGNTLIQADVNGDGLAALSLGGFLISRYAPRKNHCTPPLARRITDTAQTGDPA